MYATPVLLSGLASLVLSKEDVNILEKHYLETIRRLLKLHDRTPRCAVYFLAGSLPGTALLHLRQLNLFGMICRLPQNILNQHARDVFSSRLHFKGSWFDQIKNLCLTYHLPQPIDMLDAPLQKDASKTLFKKKVVDYWEVKLRQEASLLPSLNFFNPNYMSLTKVHPLWLTAGHSPYKVTMATVQAKMLSGRYRCGALTRHWTNSDGNCRISSECIGQLDDLVHILQLCPALDKKRHDLSLFTLNYSFNLPSQVGDVLRQNCNLSAQNFCAFLLDCSTDPAVISLVQEFGINVLEVIFTVTRIWIFNLHRERLRLLGAWRGNHD